MLGCSSTSYSTSHSSRACGPSAMAWRPHLAGLRPPRVPSRWRGAGAPARPLALPAPAQPPQAPGAVASQQRGH
eukprot:9639377-Lingulodinium_polyedra.AAC.1